MRRYVSFYTLNCVLLLLALSVSKPIKAQDSLDVIRGSNKYHNKWLKFSDASYGLYHHLARQAYELLDQRAHAVAKLHSLGGWKARQQKVKQTLQDIVGPFPPKTPLHARVTKTVDKKGYRIEDIVYQSQPGFYVTSSLFIPEGIDKPAPAILFCIGHSMRSYRRPSYQHTLLNLVKKGFIVLVFDPVGQGERIEYYDKRSGKSEVGGSATDQHNYPGVQAFITGSTLARYEIWDGIRGIDYLASRPEVDPNRIGVNGISGGGTQTAYIAELDKRVAAAPENFITNFTRLIQYNLKYEDAEQYFSHEIISGIDHADFLEVRAPKPTLMISTTRDQFFPIQGSIETAREAARIYNAYGTSGRFGMVTDNAIHTYTKKNRGAMYGFFQKYLDNPGDSTDLEVKPLSNGELQVTKTGQVSTSIKGAETVFSLNRKKAKKEEKKLQAARKDLGRHLPKAVRAAKKLSGYREPDSVDRPIFAGRFQKDGYAIEKYFVMGEGGDYPIPYLLLVPDKPNGKGLIYLDPAGKTAHLRQQERLACRQMGPVLSYAAAFDSSLAKIALIKPYSSYRSMVETKYYNPAYIHSTVAGALKAYDLPDLVASLVPQKLLMAGIKNGAGKPADSETIGEDADVIKTAYQDKSASQQLKIARRESVTNLQDMLKNWLK